MKLTAESTVLDDKKIGDSFATLQVEADGIRTEVSTKVGNDEVISRINQTAESIKIQADKVNIEGATIFTSGRLSQSSLDGAYDASGSATSAVNGLKTDLSSASGTTVINGGHIETGTLLSNSIKADSGEFNTALIPNLSANKITTDTINIARIPATARNDTYITDIGSDGIRVHDSHTSNNSVVINASGMEVFKGGTAPANSVAFYGDSVRTGRADTRHIEIVDGGLQVYQNATTMLANLGYGPGNAETGIATAPFMTLGTRTASSEVGNYSVAEGLDIEASAFCGHAEGAQTHATGNYSHAEGFMSTASGVSAHAEGGSSARGSYSHAEGGWSSADGDYSHAGGLWAYADGDYSFAHGNRVRAVGEAQTVIGRFNRWTLTDTTNAFIVGNGSSESARSNAFAVCWDGEVHIALGSDTTDTAITTALTALGWSVTA